MKWSKRREVEKAAPGHVADVRLNFIDLFTPAELDLLATLNERILQHLATNYDPAAEDGPAEPPSAPRARRGPQARLPARGVGVGFPVP